MGGSSEQSLVVLLARLSKAIYRRADAAVLGTGLKEYLALANLRDGAIPQQVLADRLHMDENNLVLLLNGLEEGELISRRRDPDDRRRHIVEVTNKGRKALERAERGMAGLEHDLLGSLSQSDRLTLKRLVLRILDGQASGSREAELTAARSRDDRR
jgi:MarR family transcriptional regulator, temperature-dependent positive regulator of motility